nr:hypothetical protein [Candidatus Sigynarchaeota archaeon]
MPIWIVLCTIVAVMLVSSIIQRASGAWTLQREWYVEDTDTMDGAYHGIGDIDGDGELEIVVCGYDTLSSYSGEGIKEWTCNLPSIVDSCYYYSSREPSLLLLDTNGDGTKEILCITTNKFLYCINGSNHAVLWSIALNRTILRLVSTDLDSNRCAELILGCQDGTLIFIDTQTRAIGWEYNASSSMITALCILNLDAGDPVGLFVGDGAGRARCYALNSSFNLLWTFTLSSSIRPYITVGDVDGNLIPDVIFSTSDSIFCISCSGDVVWTSSAYGGFSANPLLVDIDKDGTLNLIFSTSSSTCCVDMTTNSSVWVKPCGPIKISVCDINFDDTFEIILDRISQIDIISGSTGVLVGSYSDGLDYTDFSICDLDDDGILELLRVGRHHGMKAFFAGLICWNLNCPRWCVPGSSATRGGSFLETNDYTDSDGDGLSNDLERCIGTNPFVIDTDFDTLD